MKQTHFFTTASIKVLLAGVLSVLLVSCNNSIETKEENQACIDATFVDKIQLKSIEQKQIKQQLHLTGRVETNPDAVVPFTSMVGGQILTTHFSIGDAVTKGQVLAEVRSAELTSLQNEQKKNESNLMLAKHALEKVQSRFDSGFSSKSELLEIESKVAQLKNDIQAMSETLSLYSATSRQGVFQIKAPSSGFIIEKNINAGQQIPAESDPLFVISNLESVWVVANLYASDVSKVNVGNQAKIEAIAYPGEILHGEVASIAQVFDAEEQVLKARIPMDNKEQKLIPGSLVDVWLESESTEVVNAVKTEAVIFDDNEYKIVLYTDACDLRVIEIKPVAQDPEFTYFHETAKTSEKYVMKNQLLLYNHLNELD
ncbi:MAG TPA: efflux RND transporter periplasmic adaptor subunit [Flavobacteriaceae bacterium]|nr:efflux RND transporter periplasmic adaptor subunit [Flavobacteriaceae bacterium]